MHHRFAAVTNGALVAALFAVAAWSIHGIQGAGQVAIHWGPDNRADAWVGGASFLLVNPIVALVIWFLVSMVPEKFVAQGRPVGTAQARMGNLFLVQLVVQLVLAIAVSGA